MLRYCGSGSDADVRQTSESSDGIIGEPKMQCQEQACRTESGLLHESLPARTLAAHLRAGLAQGLRSRTCEDCCLADRL